MVVIELFLLALITGGLWLWMARANKRGRSWARITGTVFFGVLTAGNLAWLAELLVEKDSLNVYSILGLLFFVAYWLVALSAVVLLWQRSSSDFYAASGTWSKAMRAAARKPHDQPAVRRQMTGPDPS